MAHRRAAKTRPTGARWAAAVLAVLFATLCAPAAVAQSSADGPRLQLSVTEISPRVVDPSSTTLTLTGTVTNTGDRRISDLQVRLELGARESTERQLRAVMTGTAASPESMSRFVDIAPSTLAPGQTGSLKLTVRLDGSANGLKINNAGVYPLLVNVNGTPDYGGPARLASLSLLLPVLGAPGKSPAPAPNQPAKVTMLWPIADTRPRIVAAPYGQRVVLGDDVLASELRPGGRLDALVATARAARKDPKVAGALCYVVDPDLLDTVEAMTHGYDVRTPAGNVEGSGADAAKAWLDSLRDLVAGQCVIQMPYADADLPALANVRGGDLLPYALNTSARVQQILGMGPLPGVLWANGPLNAAALGGLNDAGVTTVIADPADFGDIQLSGGVALGSDVRAEPVDALVATGFDGTPSRAQSASTPPQDPAIAAQNGLAALAFRGGLGTSTAATKPVLVAPPRRWSLPEAELAQLLRTFGDFISRGMLTPVPLPQLLATATGSSGTMRYSSSPTPQDVTDEMASIEETMADLRSAMTVDPTAQVNPDQVLLPLRYALVRNCSTAWNTAGAARVSAHDSRTQLNALLRQVAVDTPAVPISMASGEAPLPVSLRNSLPVQVVVKITVENNAGLLTGELPDRQLLPAGLTNKVLIPMEALRAGKFSVTVNLTTPGGTPLGNPARFDLRSNEYGVVTLVLTIAGGAALVLLSARQIYRRVKTRRRE